MPSLAVLVVQVALVLEPVPAVDVLPAAELVPPLELTPPLELAPAVEVVPAAEVAPAVDVLPPLPEVAPAVEVPAPAPGAFASSVLAEHPLNKASGATIERTIMKLELRLVIRRLTSVFACEFDLTQIRRAFAGNTSCRAWRALGCAGDRPNGVLGTPGASDECLSFELTGALGARRLRRPNAGCAAFD